MATIAQLTVGGMMSLALSAGFGAAFGCTTVIQPPKEAEPCKQQIVNMEILASPRINPSDSGEARPVQLRIYQLTTDVRLNNASFEKVWKDDKGVLKDDLIKSEEMSIFPDSRTDVRFERDPNALVIAAVALFREPKGRSWYMTLELPPSPTKGACGQKDADGGADGGSPLNPHYAIWIEGSRVDDGSDHLEEYPRAGRQRTLSLPFSDKSGGSEPTLPAMPSMPSAPSLPSAPTMPTLPSAPTLPTAPSAPSGLPGT